MAPPAALSPLARTQQQLLSRLDGARIAGAGYRTARHRRGQGPTWPRAVFFAPTPSGTGYQLSVFGLSGVLFSLAEGVEVNLLGLTLGIDFRDPAIKLPGIGRIALLPAALQRLFVDNAVPPEAHGSAQPFVVETTDENTVQLQARQRVSGLT